MQFATPVRLRVQTHCLAVDKVEVSSFLPIFGVQRESVNRAGSISVRSYITRKHTNPDSLRYMFYTYTTTYNLMDEPNSLSLFLCLLSLDCTGRRLCTFNF
jgi:hypothetical protein